MHLTTDSIFQVIHDVKRAAIKQTKRKALVIQGTIVEIKVWESLADQLHHTPTNLPSQAPRADNGGDNWMTGDVPHASRHCPEHHPGDMEPESDNETHFKNSLTDIWAREHGTEWVSHIPYPYQAGLSAYSWFML